MTGFKAGAEAGVVNQRRKKLEDTGNHATYEPWQKLVTAVECQKMMCCGFRNHTMTPKSTKMGDFSPKKAHSTAVPQNGLGAPYSTTCSTKWDRRLPTEKHLAGVTISMPQ